MSPGTPPGDRGPDERFLTEWARDAVERAGLPAAGDVSWLARPVVSWDLLDGARILRCDQIVVKFHAPNTEPDALRRRLAAIASEPLGRYWVRPVRPEPMVGPGRRLVTLWPYREALAPGGAEPWSDAGRLLAGLHRVPHAGPALAHGGFERLRRAVTVAAGSSDVLPTWLVDRGESVLRARPGAEEPRWVHGDFHLGQLAREPGGPWSLIDPDDLGGGDPAWDLGRPAALWATGLLDDRSWSEFVDAYRQADGPGIPPRGDPWATLDLPARAAAIVMCVRETTRDPGSAESGRLLAACRRMTPSDG